jgi:hypothetical protein
MDTRSYTDANNVAWATQNPSRGIIVPRPPPMHLTKAQKASQAIAHEKKKTEQDALDKEIK